MSELEKIIDKIVEQFDDISERIDGVNNTLKQTRSELIEQLKAECRKTEAQNA